MIQIFKARKATTIVPLRAKRVLQVESEKFLKFIKACTEHVEG